MKVLHVGNIASVGALLCEALNRLGHETELISKRRAILHEGSGSVPVHFVNGPLQELRLAGLNPNDYDLVHLHYLANWGAIALRSARIRVPVLLHAHGSDTRPATPGHAALTRWVAGLSDDLVYSTPDLENHVEWFQGRKSWLPNPAPEFQPRSPAVDSCRSDRILIYTTMHKVKRLEDLFVRIRDWPWKFDCPDAGPDRGHYRRIAPPNVRFIPPIPRENLRDTLTQYPLILGGSQDGVLRMCEMEAMQMGIPTLFPFGYDHCYDDPLPMEPLTREAVERNKGDGRLGVQQRDWIRRFHSPERVAGLVLEKYHDLTGL